MAGIYCKLCGATDYRAEGATVRKWRLTADDGELQQSRPDQWEVSQNSRRSIVSELTTNWSWNEEGTEPTLPLSKVDRGP